MTSWDYLWLSTTLLSSLTSDSERITNDVDYASGVSSGDWLTSYGLKTKGLFYDRISLFIVSSSYLDGVFFDDVKVPPSLRSSASGTGSN